MAVLICTSETSDDPCVTTVSAAIERLGGQVLRLASDAFPTDLRLSLELGAGPPRWSGGLPMRDVTAVWLRELEAGARLASAGLREDLLAAARLESENALASMLGCLDAFQLDPLHALQSAPAKPGQLRLARTLGIDVPRSLLSNDPEAVRSFFAACPHGMVAKMVSSGAIGVGEGADSQPVYTQQIVEADLAHLDSLCLSPMLFQERVPKASELRVTVVGAELFVAAIEISADAPVDWRTDPSQVSGFRPSDALPDAVGRALLTMLDRLDLNFATFDLILTPDGRCVFLEMNTISYFDFVERAAGLPISEAVAALLLGLRPPRPGTSAARRKA